MKAKKIINIALGLITGIVLLVAGGCKKFLDEKPNQAYAEPTTLTDMQGLLDFYQTMSTKDASAGEISADNYFLNDDNYDAQQTETARRMYTWQKDNVFDPQFNDWANIYKSVYVANLVLSDLANVQNADPKLSENIRGQALVYRAKNFLEAAIIWSPAYDQNSAGTDLGIPLRLTADDKEKSIRATNQDTYARIISDLKAAVPFLPEKQVSPLRPSKAAAYGLLARTYLVMNNYVSAGLYADSCLQLQNTLIDFKTLTASFRFPISKLNDEVIFESNIPNGGPISSAYAFIDTGLYASYENTDLRKKVFFKSNAFGYFSFKGSYEGASSLFSGLATDEMYLTRAESFARAGNADAAMKDLNTLLKARYNASFTDKTAVSVADALDQILADRRKELLMRGLRWADLKRLNKSGAGIVLYRYVHGTTYTLPPNDLRYALPIPSDVIALTGMPQNPR